jgi:hypothetical protein
MAWNHHDITCWTHDNFCVGSIAPTAEIIVILTKRESFCGAEIALETWNQRRNCYKISNANTLYICRDLENVGREFMTADEWHLVGAILHHAWNV